MSYTTFTYRQDESVALGERFPSKSITIESECDDLDAHELLDLFKSFMVGCGYAEKSFYDACDQAAQENPYAKGRNGSKLGQTNEIWHSGGYDYPHKDTTPEKGYEDNYKYPTGM